jgi:hypothetical protein
LESRGRLVQLLTTVASEHSGMGARGSTIAKDTPAQGLHGQRRTGSDNQPQVPWIFVPVKAASRFRTAIAFKLI